MKIPDRVEVVLVPTDASFFSRRGLLAGATLASRLGAQLRLFSAVAAEDDVAARDAELQELIKWAECAGDVQRSIVVDLDPAGAIHEELRRLGSAIACMASHGHGRSAALMGSVTTDIVARGHDPVILAGHLVEQPPDGRGVVACVNEDAASAAVIPVALRLSQLLSEPVTVITVAEPAPEPVRDVPLKRAFGPDGDVSAFLEELVGPYRSEGADIATEPVWDPVSPASGVESYLRDHPHLLAVAGTHPRTGVERFVLGSVAAAIVRRSPDPVLIVPLEASS